MNALSLFALYTVQGLPFGFQVKALKLLVRQSGASLESLGALTLLSLPWLLKALLAPVVDSKTSVTFGRRRTWLLPVLSLLAATMLAAAHVCSASSGGGASGHPLDAQSLWALLALVFTMNTLAATSDIATDGLAVEVFANTDAQLGVGNVCQVRGASVVSERHSTHMHRELLCHQQQWWWWWWC
jgi:PAT family beta-lactamase induction signal transducer AmpG